VGSRDLKQFAFVGRAVNVAARVQELTRQHPADIILTENVKAQLDPRFSLRALPSTQLKGTLDPIAIYAVLGFEEVGAAAGTTPS
jgi:class 3 adenylate cyclase